MTAWCRAVPARPWSRLPAMRYSLYEPEHDEFRAMVRAEAGIIGRSVGL